MEEKKKSGLGTAGLVLGIIGLCTSIIPIVNNLSFIMGILAVIFGIITLVKKTGKGKSIAALILGILTIVVTLLMQSIFSKALNSVVGEINNNIDQSIGNSTEEILNNYVDVTLGNFEVDEGKYGLTSTKLVAKVTNKKEEVKSFTIHIEAVDAAGSRIDDAYIYANDLGAGQSQDFSIFTFVSSDKVDAMKNATFKIVGCTML